MTDALVSPKRALIEDRLAAQHQPALVPLIAALRDDDRSWRWIARFISDQTGVPISHVAVRRYATPTQPQGEAA